MTFPAGFISRRVFRLLRDRIIGGASFKAERRIPEALPEAGKR
ncbi:hypothetical protein EL18_03120 [Nitratireductor basaltis]|uniref:Uncharacterized protein n=1 Tax=Nitratireductor basaltis TaxID=472175 RepID=A0A084U7C9_9HYPH|nr:hypothetical protein EL18_03120 [Nitratireductor basaltis]